MVTMAQSVVLLITVGFPILDNLLDVDESRRTSITYTP